MNETINILHISCTHNPDDDRIFYREGLSLKKHYSSISIIGVDKQERVDTKRGIRILAVKEANYKKNIQEIMMEVQKQKPNLLHVHDLFILKQAMKYAKGKKIPLIYDVHEHFPLLVKRYLPGSLLKKEAHYAMLSLLEKRESHQASHIITVVPQLTERFSRWNNHVTEIRNYPRKDLFQKQEGKETPKLRSLRDVAKDHIVIIYAGNISRYRNLFLMGETIKALNKESNSYIGVTLGDGEKEDIDAWETYCNTSGGQLIHLGYVPHENIPQYLREAHLGWCVLPNYSPFTMSLPNKIFEYLACGLPFIASNFYTICYLFKNNPAALLVSEEDPKVLSARIHTAFPHRAYLQELRKIAKKTFLNQFTWESEESKLLDVYQQVLGGYRNNDKIS